MKRPIHIRPGLGFLATLVIALAAPAVRAQEGEAPEGEGDEQTADEDENASRYLAIVGGDVYTGTGSVLRGATVLSRDGKIRAIGHDVFLPEGTEVVDAAGLRVYPGLIALSAATTITGGLFSAEADRGDHFEKPEIVVREILGHVVPDGLEDPDGGLAPELDGEDGPVERSEVEDGFDPFSTHMVLALATGITTAQQQNAAVKLKRDEIDGVLLSERHLSSMNWGVNNPSGTRSTRERLAKASAYLREYRAWQDRGNKEEKEPSKRGVDASTLKILTGETLAYFRNSTREDLLGIARLAQEFGFRPVIEGCEEGWTVADELGRAGAYAILVPRRRMSHDEHFARAGGASIENAAILHRSGVQVAVHPESTGIDTIGIAGRDLLALPIEAGFAVRGGLPEDAALEAMTIVPARLLGIEHRVGTLEVGKDLDAIVTDGDVLHYQTFVQYAVVDGKLVYDKEKEIFFAHIRPRPARPEPEAKADSEAEPEPEADKGEASKEDPGDESEEKPEEDAEDE
jgi:hypothetical protein